MTNLQTLIAQEDAADAAREARRAMIAEMVRMNAAVALDQGQVEAYRDNLTDELNALSDFSLNEFSDALAAYDAAVSRG